MTKESPADPTAEPIRPEATLDNTLTLKQAMRTARLDDAERQGVQADLRAGQIARLELLEEALKPLLAQIPSDAADLFDVGLMPSATPRLFIDMIGFVEMGRDSRVYRLLQDSRYTRLKIAESASVPSMVDAITQYVARRLLEREKALAADRANAGPISGSAVSSALWGERNERAHNRLQQAGAVLAFVIDLLGAIAFFAILVSAGLYLWSRVGGRI